MYTITNSSTIIILRKLELYLIPAVEVIAPAVSRSWDSQGVKTPYTEFKIAVSCKHVTSGGKKSESSSRPFLFPIS